MTLSSVRLHHTTLNSRSRFIRLVLAEKGVDFSLHFEKYWDKRPSFLALNPAGEVPVMQFDQEVICGAIPIFEYLEEVVSLNPLLGSTLGVRAESRRLMEWFVFKFERDVLSNLIEERITKRITRSGTPDARLIKLSRDNLRLHLGYMSSLIEARDCLNISMPSAGDFAAAASISCLDYLGEIVWSEFETVAIWYSRMKSRKSFKSILSDEIPAIKPSVYYSKIDFI